MKKSILDVPMGYGGESILLRNTESSAKSVGIDIGNGSTFERIQIDLLDPFPENREIRTTNIQDLADNIKENGFNGAIVVVPEEDGKPLDSSKAGRYMIISGHRRVEAFKMILEDVSGFMHRKIPAVVLPKGLPYDKLYSMNVLYNCMTAPESPIEARERVTKMVSLMEQNGIKKKLYKSVSEQLKISERQVRKYVDISTKLISGLLKEYDDGNLNVNDANLYAACSVEAQEEILSIIKDKGSLTDDEYHAIKDADSTVRDELEKSKKIVEEQEATIEQLKRENKSIREIRNAEQTARRARETTEELKNVIKHARSESDQIDSSAAILVSETLSKLSLQTQKLVKKKEKGYVFSEADKAKITLLIDDLQKL